MDSCHIRGCIHTNVAEYYTTLSHLHFYTTIYTLGPNIVCNDQLNRARVEVFFTFGIGHVNFSKKMQASFKHGSCLGEFGCKTPQKLVCLSNTVDAIKYHVNCIDEAE